MRKKTVRDLDDAQVRDRRALVRVDFNVPLDEDGRITDDTRIRASLPTIELLLERRARPVILSHLGNPARPFVAILGGAKISGKIDVIEQLLPKVDGLLIGGAMACTFYRAMGLETGKSLVEEDRVPMAKSLLDRAGMRLTLPHDAMVAPSLERASEAKAVPRNAIPKDQAMFDIGPQSV